MYATSLSSIGSRLSHGEVRILLGTTLTEKYLLDYPISNLFLPNTKITK